VHVEDISRAFAAMLQAPRELVHDQAFNIGRQADNVQVRDIAELVMSTVPGSVVTCAEGAGPDLRSYRVDFSKLSDAFPDLKLHWSVADGVTELVRAYSDYGITYADFVSPRFVRLRRVRELIGAELVDEQLRRLTDSGFPPPSAQMAREV